MSAGPRAGYWIKLSETDQENEAGQRRPTVMIPHFNVGRYVLWAIAVLSFFAAPLILFVDAFALTISPMDQAIGRTLPTLFGTACICFTISVAALTMMKR